MKSATSTECPPKIWPRLARSKCIDICSCRYVLYTYMYQIHTLYLRFRFLVIHETVILISYFVYIKSFGKFDIYIICCRFNLVSSVTNTKPSCGKHQDCLFTYFYFFLCCTVLKLKTIFDLATRFARSIQLLSCCCC